MPQDAESYVHRIGRTGRAGREGKAFSFISDRDIDSLERVEQYTKNKIEAIYMEDTELIKDLKPLKREEPSYRGKFDKPRPGGRGQDRDRRPGKKFDARTPGGKKPYERQPERPTYDPNKKPDLKTLKPDPKPNGAAKKFQPSKPQQQKSGYVAGAQSQPQQKAKPAFNSKPSNKNFRSNSSGGYKKQPAKDASLGQKVKSFFQKIFG